MYMNRMIGVGKAENGFVVECYVPFKPSAKKSTKEDMPEPICGSCEKQYIAKDAAEVSNLIDKLMPMLDAEYTSEDQFDAAFEKAAAK